MKTFALLTLVATGALAAPGTSMRQARAAEKLRGRQDMDVSGYTQPMIPVDGPVQFINGPDGVIHNASFSSNWAGAVLNNQTGFTSVTGTTVIPKPRVPAGGKKSEQYFATAWVGIDGDACQAAILQAGVDIAIQNGKETYSAWYEWFPDFSHDFNNFKIRAGDSVKITVTATSKTGGKAVLQNLTTGKSTSHTFRSQGASLCETDAEWIIEDFSQGDSLVPFADFGKWEFTNATAIQSGKQVGVTGAEIINIKQNNSTIYTDCSLTGPYGVSCTYTQTPA